METNNILFHFIKTQTDIILHYKRKLKHVHTVVDVNIRAIVQSTPVERGRNRNGRVDIAAAVPGYPEELVVRRVAPVNVVFVESYSLRFRS